MRVLLLTLSSVGFATNTKVHPPYNSTCTHRQSGGRYLLTTHYAPCLCHAMLHLGLGLRVAMVTAGIAGIASGDHTPSMVTVSVTEPSRRCSMQYRAPSVGTGHCSRRWPSSDAVCRRCGSAVRLPPRSRGRRSILLADPCTRRRKPRRTKKSANKTANEKSSGEKHAREQR